VVARALSRSKERRHAGVAELAGELEPYAERDLAARASRKSQPSHRAPAGLGMAETEIESAPTWVALASTPNPKAGRNCKQLSVPESKAQEDFCRHPLGAAPMPVAVAHTTHLSQRALLLSVGALALSVVAMTTMFIFVYSHGSGALESAAHASGRAQQAARATHAALGAGAPAAEPQPVSKQPAPGGADFAAPRQLPSAPVAARQDGSPAPATRLAGATGACTKRQDPLYRASVVELSADGESHISVQRQALQPANPDCE
jgi:hypothetical protein